jgi:selenocysteine lyase/cysteine desulfurase
VGANRSAPVRSLRTQYVHVPFPHIDSDSPACKICHDNSRATGREGHAVLHSSSSAILPQIRRKNVTKSVTSNPAQLDYAARAARFDLGTPPLINAYAARAGIELVMAAGVERIRRQLERLSELAHRLAPQSGLHITGSQHIHQQGATTAIDASSPENAHRLEEELRRRSVIVSARGRAIRLAPHGFTREEEMEQAVDTVAELLRS